MAAQKKKRTYFPPKTFDDDLVALAALFKRKGWSFSNVDIAALTEAGVTQREEREAHDEAELQFRNLHEAFGQAQEQRHQAFSAALNAARGAFKNDRAVSKELEKFTRSAKRTVKKTG
ncbi:MAG: hypothetical protein HY904_19655 [Deltaproteobacteria bacterium]|nr:hypothetical protein [Deltaproteobacteria bacterium]